MTRAEKIEEAARALSSAVLWWDSSERGVVPLTDVEYGYRRMTEANLELRRALSSPPPPATEPEPCACPVCRDKRGAPATGCARCGGTGLFVDHPASVSCPACQGSGRGVTADGEGS